MATVTPAALTVITEMTGALSIPDAHLNMVRSSQEEERAALGKSIKGAFEELSLMNSSQYLRLEQVRSQGRQLEMTLRAQLKEARSIVETEEKGNAKQLEDTIAAMNKLHERHTASITAMRELHQERRTLDEKLMKLRYNNELLKRIVTPCGGSMLSNPGGLVSMLAIHAAAEQIKL